MTRRSERRQYAILGALHEHGPLFELDLCNLLYRWPGTLYPDLASLEGDGLVVGEWQPHVADKPRRRRYRVTTDAERDDGRRRLQEYLLVELAKPTDAQPWRIPIARPGTRPA